MSSVTAGSRRPELFPRTQVARPVSVDKLQQGFLTAEMTQGEMGEAGGPQGVRETIALCRTLTLRAIPW